VLVFAHRLQRHTRYGGTTTRPNDKPWLPLLERFRSKRAARSETLSPSPDGSHLEEKVLGYNPNPIDTSKVQVSDDIFELTEHLAENAHEVWAQRRMAEGWSYGPRRDEAKKEHPSLVPYKDLPESEKEYDRSTAMETLKVLLAMGYRIEKDP
jgi:RyR domain